MNASDRAIVNWEQSDPMSPVYAAKLREIQSDRVTGMQWDLPYGWAPLQLIPIEGLRRYGFNEDADRLSQEFVSDVYDNFTRDHTIREKYNVITRSTQAQVSLGYKTNVVGFGWTNGVTLVLLDSKQPQAH